MHTFARAFIKLGMIGELSSSRRRVSRLSADPRRDK